MGAHNEMHQSLHMQLADHLQQERFNTSSWKQPTLCFAAATLLASQRHSHQYLGSQTSYRAFPDLPNLTAVATSCHVDYGVQAVQTEQTGTCQQRSVSEHRQRAGQLDCIKLHVS